MKIGFAILNEIRKNINRYIRIEWTIKKGALKDILCSSLNEQNFFKAMKFLLNVFNLISSVW
jgi:predicted methyltransferase